MRRLLIKGADKNLTVFDILFMKAYFWSTQAKDGKRAIDLALESDFDNIVLLLVINR